MIKKVTVAGIQLDNYPVREAIMQMERCMVEESFSTVEEVTMDMLIHAKNSEKLQMAYKIITHTVVAETVVLDAAGVDSFSRKHEIENHLFFSELLKRFERNRKTVFLLGMEEEDLGIFREKISENFPRIEVAGEAAAKLCMGDWAAIVNEINAANPDVVISLLPTPEEEYFLLDNRNKISARLWYGIGSVKFQEKKHPIKDFFRRHHGIRTLREQEDTRE